MSAQRYDSAAVGRSAPGLRTTLNLNESLSPHLGWEAEA